MDWHGRARWGWSCSGFLGHLTCADDFLVLSDKLQAAERVALEMVARDVLIGSDVAYERAMVIAHGHHFILLLQALIGIDG